MIHRQKHEELKKILKNMGSAAIAFSGGVDSTYLLLTANEVLGSHAAAITVKSPTFPERELRDADEFALKLGVKHITVESGEEDIQLYEDNPPDRCYICKKAIFGKILEKAAENGITHVVDGSNTDDLGDYRPGMKALRELGIESPLIMAGLTKNDIRTLSRELGLPAWNKPAYACLATRFPVGERITPEKLKMVERAEQYLFDAGFRQVRVRHHGDIARIEVESGERSLFFDDGLMDRVNGKLREIGFKYVSLDLGGYKMGNMNTILSESGGKYR
jgi:uncharacterized protein